MNNEGITQMTKKIENLKDVSAAIAEHGFTYAEFCERVDLTVYDLAAITGYSELTIRHWIDYSEGLINEHGEDLEG